MKLDRPPYILIFPGDQSGCGFHRCLRPAELLSKAGCVAARVEYKYLPDDVIKAMEPDVIIWQRPSEEFQLAIMERYRTLLPDSFFLYELDDSLGSIPDKSWHKPYMVSDIETRISKAASLCDLITVTTVSLAEHMKKLCPDTPVRIVPNMLGRDDLERTARVIAERPVRPAESRFRIGWGGGIGHGGDLELLRQAFEDLKDEVHWVFVGHAPPMPDGTEWRFAGAVPPQKYLETLASIDVDLIVAPLEDNHFNACKSNLRILEAAACGYPVIASPVSPYRTKHPPILYAATPDDWTARIREVMACGPERRTAMAGRLTDWLKKHYIVEERLAERAAMWLPDGCESFMPRRSEQGHAVHILSTAKDIEEACKHRRGDIIYKRESVAASDDVLRRLAGRGADPRAASISVLTNDGGPAGFPQVNQFTPLSEDYAIDVARLALGFDRIVPTSVAAGPAIVLRRHALDILGAPDFDRWDSPELAILEWSVAASARGFTHLVDCSTFVHVRQPDQHGKDVIDAASMRLAARWPQVQADPAPLALAREGLEAWFYRNQYHAPLTTNPTDYDFWTRTFDSMGPKTMQACLDWFKAQERPGIEVIQYDGQTLTPERIAAINAPWALFVPKNAVPAPTMIADFADAIACWPDAAAIYADHDHLVDGKRARPDFKPELDLHLLMGRDYVTQAVAIPIPASFGQLFAGGNDEDCLYQLVLHAALTDRTSVRHLPRIAVHLIERDPALQAERTKAKAVIADRFMFERRLSANIEPHPHLPAYAQVSYRRMDSEQLPRVTVIIPTKDKVEMLEPCLATLLQMTTYPNFDVLVVDNGSTRPEMLEFLSSYTVGERDSRVRIMLWPEPYNWSRLNNWATEQCPDAEIFCFLNDDTRVIAPEWLDEMVGAADFPGVGAVGAKLLYPSGTVQHIGVISTGGLSGHMHKDMPSWLPGYHGIAALSHEATAVTGACMLVRRDVFKRAGRFDENLAHNFNDVAFCLEVRKLGLVNVVVIEAQLQHFEGVTRTSPMTEEGANLQIADAMYMAARYQTPDPYWNPNLLFAGLQQNRLVAGTGMDVYINPPSERPWARLEFERILLLGPPQPVMAEMWDRDAIYHLTASGDEFRIAQPLMPNLRPFNVRRPAEAARIIQELGIDRVVVTALEMASPAALGFLVRLGVPVTYRPVDAEAACPMHDLRREGNACGGGWRRGECQSCIDQHGSPHGFVSIDGWRAEWARFLAGFNVAADFQFTLDSAHTAALEEVYCEGDSSDDIRAAAE